MQGQPWQISCGGPARTAPKSLGAGAAPKPLGAGIIIIVIIIILKHKKALKRGANRHFLKEKA